MTRLLPHRCCAPPSASPPAGAAMGSLLYTASFATADAAAFEANVEKLFADIVKRAREFPVRPPSAMPGGSGHGNDGGSS